MPGPAFFVVMLAKIAVVFGLMLLSVAYLTWLERKVISDFQIRLGDRLRLFGQSIDMVITDVNIGLLYLFGVASLGVYGIVLGGWASNNKYALLGGLRSAAQMISYELSMGLSVVGVLMLSES